MASSFLFSWFYSPRDSVDPVPSEELQCLEEEEGEDICWVLGEILLFYCLAVAVIKIIYHGLNWILENHSGTLPLSCRVNCSKGSCTCHCRFGFCSLIRKLFGGKEQSPVHNAPCSPSLKRQLKESISKLSQKTFCDSDSSDSESLCSQVSSWKGSLSDGSPSTTSLKQKKPVQRPKDAESHWVREQPCRRCKAKRTREWLAQHFNDRDASPQEKHN